MNSTRRHKPTDIGSENGIAPTLSRGYGGSMRMPASEELLDCYAAALVSLSGRHGLSNLRYGGSGTVIADVEPNRSLINLANFELEAETLLAHEVFVMSSDAPAAQAAEGYPRLRAAA